MSNQVKQIAKRIKELREISGVTQESLARELGVPLDTYRGYESGRSDIPVSLLYEAAARFHVELIQLLTGESPKLHTYALVRKGKGVDIRRSRSYNYHSLAYNFAGKRFEPLLVTVEPKPAGAPVETNSHPGQEFDYLLEGRLAVSIAESELTLEAGDSLYFDSTHPHSMKALDDRPARFLAIILQAGYNE